ncbi:hypothetical protein CAMGR0001_2478 [Campylobacter gracilis RM3268]|uniref:Uncharacterized protein n=1 Tax=Campylobacter gracilis RM3268 TaxID=553220 RepID=C8PFC5_9BACT|nr:hypothetical protein CAMGR0001_2478 [Campylobacter gracilis RM3268]
MHKFYLVYFSKNFTIRSALKFPLGWFFEFYSMEFSVKFHLASGDYRKFYSLKSGACHVEFYMKILKF